MIDRDVAALLSEQALNTLKADPLINLLLHVLNLDTQVTKHVPFKLLYPVESALLCQLNFTMQCRVYLVLLLIDLILRIDELLSQRLAELGHGFSDSHKLLLNLFVLERD